MHRSSGTTSVDFSDEAVVGAWRLERLRRVGWIYFGVCLACTVIEFSIGTAAVGWVYLFNTCFIAALTSALTPVNHIVLERVALATVHCTCVVSVFLSESIFNVSYVVCLLCVTSIHEQDPRWRSLWNRGYLVSFLVIAAFFLFIYDPLLTTGGVGDYYHALVPFGCSAIVLGFLLHEYIEINRQAFAGHAELNANLVDQIDLARQTSAELQEQLGARQRVSRSIAQSIANAHVTRSRLEANHEQLEQFAYAASHDLKEPVRTIRSFMQMVRRKLPAEAASDASLAEHFDFIESNAHAMHNVLERLLLYSRASRVEAVAKTCAVQRVWAAAMAKSDLPAEHKQTHLQALVTSETILVEVDSAKLQSVFAELLDNANRFVAPGASPSFCIEVDAPHDGRVTCRLTDEGIGIEEEYLHQVFGLFTRLHPREQYPSAGVGLALVKRLLEQIDGRIEIRSRVRQGTTVEVSVPAGPH